MYTGSSDDLVARIVYSLTKAVDGARPIAFLTGSGLSRGAVPMSAQIVEQIRKSIDDDADVRAFDEHLAAAKDDGEKYQQAFQWLGIRRDPGFRDKVIQIATLSACKTDDIAEIVGPDGIIDRRRLLNRAGELELESERWTLPAGQAALGRILNGLPSEKRGPVLTTNFDPLTEIAVRRSGGNPSIFVNADDTSFLANLRVQNNPFVLHLHGYWRDSTTLSTPEQLELRRPVLEASLKYILERYTLVVLGYSGWSDVIARILQDQVGYQGVESLDILWGFFDSAHVVEDLAKNHPVVSTLAAAPGNVQLYTSVDANSFLPALERSLAEHLNFEDGDRKIDPHAGLPGWTTATPDLLSSYRRAATKSAALTFIDGRIPAWHDATSPYVATRELALTLYNTLKQSIPTRDSSIDLVLGASGEGKSMVALQLAALIASDGEFGADALVVGGDYFGSDSAVLQLPDSKSYVLIIDDAYRFSTRIQELVVRMHREARMRIHLVLFSRDTDWHSSGASGFSFSSYLSSRKHALVGLTRADALSMVLTWEKLGTEALGDLASLPSTDDRVEHLLDVSQGAGLGKGKRSLLGALLATRYGSGLRQHIADLMTRLQGRLIDVNKPDSLLDALLLIALPYAYEIVDLEPAVLSEVFGLEWVDVVTQILEPLGDEAAIAYDSGRVVVRHEMIASAIVDVALEWELDLNESISRLVSAAARQLERRGYAPRTGSIAYIASRIKDLPRLAVAAATAARTTVPSRLSYVTHLSAALRRDHQAVRAIELNEGAVSLLSDVGNRDQARAYLTEWGVAEGNRNRWARNAVLVGLSLQDSSSLGTITAEKTRGALSCFLLALRRLDESAPQDELVQGMAAASTLARAFGIEDANSRAWLRAAERVVDMRGITYPNVDDGHTMTKYLKAAMWAARGRLEAPLPGGLPDGASTFIDLLRCATRVDRSS